MNSSYPATLFWGQIQLHQVGPTDRHVVQYETEQFGPHPFRVKLWKWNERQWGAIVDGGPYSIAGRWEDALVEAAHKSIGSHDSKAGQIEQHLVSCGQMEPGPDDEDYDDD